jgi:hypothetical protein
MPDLASPWQTIQEIHTLALEAWQGAMMVYQRATTARLERSLLLAVRIELFLSDAPDRGRPHDMT